MQGYLTNNVIGNVRSGTRGEKDNPIKLAHFDVHLDPSTSELAVEIFNNEYDKPNSLKIRFLDQTPMKIGYQRYEGKKLKCYGNGEKAKELSEKGKRQLINCNPEECPYRKIGERKCKMIGRLYFLIHKLENDGIWCYPMGSEKGIENIWRRIYRANRLGEDITKDWYELYLKPEDTALGKNYIPDIKKIGIVNNQDVNNTSDSSKNERNSKLQEQNRERYLKVLEFKKTNYEDKEATKIVCIDPNSKTRELILILESNQEILNCKVNSIILPMSISTRNGIEILNDYKIVKKVA